MKANAKSQIGLATIVTNLQWRIRISQTGSVDNGGILLFGHFYQIKCKQKMKEILLAQQAETCIASQELTVKESKRNFPIVDVGRLNQEAVRYGSALWPRGAS